MIFKVLMIGVLVTLCFGDHQKELKGDHDEELVKEIKAVPIPYNFEYNTEDLNGTSQFRKESSDGNGKVQGRYGYKDAFGVERIVEYVADENGYRAQIKTNEPGTDSMNPAAVQFSAQPMQMSYQISRESEKHQKQRESAENKKKNHHAADIDNVSVESPLPYQQQNQQYSTIASTQSPSYQQYTFFGQEQPNVVVHHGFGEPPVAIPVQESSTTEYKPISLGFYSAPQQPYVNLKSQEQQYTNPKSQEQQFNSPKLQMQYYANQKSQEQQYNQKSQEQQYNQKPQEQQYNQKSQDQQNNQKSQDQQYNQKSQDKQYNQKSQEQQHNLKSQEQQYNQKSQDQQYINQKIQQRHSEILKPQEQQYTNQKSQELQYNNLKSQEQQYDNPRSQEQIVHLYTPNLQYTGQNIPQQDILIRAKQYYNQPSPQNLLHSTVQNHGYSLLPIPQAYSQDSNVPLVHQYIPLQNQAVVLPKNAASTIPLKYAHFPAYSREYSAQEKQISALSAQIA